MFRRISLTAEIFSRGSYIQVVPAWTTFHIHQGHLCERICCVDYGSHRFPYVQFTQLHPGEQHLILLVHGYQSFVQQWLGHTVQFSTHLTQSASFWGLRVPLVLWESVGVSDMAFDTSMGSDEFCAWRSGMRKRINAKISGTNLMMMALGGGIDWTRWKFL